MLGSNSFQKFHHLQGPCGQERQRPLPKKQTRRSHKPEASAQAHWPAHTQDFQLLRTLYAPSRAHGLSREAEYRGGGHTGLPKQVPLMVGHKVKRSLAG